MKKIFLLILLSIILESCMTLKLIKGGNIEEIINVYGSKDDLYAKAHAWMLKTFGDEESFIKYGDKDSGTLTGKYFLTYHYRSNDLPRGSLQIVRMY